MTATYILRANEEKMPSEVYDHAADAFVTFKEWPHEYVVFELRPDGTWSDLTKSWTYELAIAEPVGEYA